MINGFNEQVLPSLQSHRSHFYAVSQAEKILDKYPDYHQLRDMYEAVAIDGIGAAYDWLYKVDAEKVTPAKYLLNKYFYLPEIRGEFERKAAIDIFAACSWLSTFESKHLKLKGFCLNLASSEKSISDTAAAMEVKCTGMLNRAIGQMKNRGKTPEDRVKHVMLIDEMLSNTYGVKRVIENRKGRLPSGDEISEAVIKWCKASWWRRQIKSIVGIKLELAARDLGLVCKRKGGYCSSWSLKRRSYQRRSNKKLLESLLIENEIGQVFTLDEVAKLGVSHLPNRRAELMTRLSGFESFADNDRESVNEAVFVTLTCPSRFHSHNRNGGMNPKWDGSNPIEAQASLNNVWRLTRTAWDDAGIKVFGFRIAEPHHDGCPHWHLVLWMNASQVNHAMQLFRNYSLLDHGDESGADKRRFIAEVIDRGEGRSATGYVAKYVSKNIDGLGEDGEAWSGDSVRTAMRVDAWRSTWNIRQFQQIGGASVTVWRELRRLHEGVDDSNIEAIRKAADDGDWEAYTRLMGGVLCKRADRPLKPVMTNRDRLNDYGQSVKYIFGLIYKSTGAVIGTRLHEWHIRPSRVVEQVSSAIGIRAPPPAPLDLCQ